MHTFSSIRAVATAALLLSAADLVGAQERPLFEWSGTIMNETHLVMQGRDVRTRRGGGGAWDQQQRNGRVLSTLPRQDGVVTVRLLDGRGRADVIQQPDPVNNYTTIVRVRDVRGGGGQFHVVAHWEPFVEDDEWYPYERGNGGGRPPVIGRGRIDPRDLPRADGFRPALHWRGSVDDEVELRVTGDRVEWRTLRGSNPEVQVSRLVTGGLPRRDVEIRVERLEGRGSVSVVEQPSARNGYTAVLRVRDRLSGSALYDLDLLWR